MKTLFLFFALLSCLNSTAQVVLKDIFGRDLQGQKIILVDWEGYMANPSIQLSIQAPANATFPLTVNVTANGSRLYFNTPSAVSGTGPTKSIVLNNSTPVSFYLSIFPDRDGANENYTLTVNSNAGLQTYPIFVLDQDDANPTTDFTIITDFSRDNPAYHFFSNQRYRTIVTEAANDWAFFIQNMNFDQVPANDESTFIWNDEGASPDGYWTSNQSAYSGFLLYAYGIQTYTHHSGGSPSLNGFQKINGVSTQLRRSGGFDAEVNGNYNTLGWDTSITDNTWYKATNFGDVPNDLYSIAMHEIGHALCFNPGYPVFENYKAQGYIDNAGVVAYQKIKVPIDSFDHLSNGATEDTAKIVDRVSKKGAFGSEYAAVVPYGRWLISKVNLLCLKAIGYNIKQTSAFAEVSITTANLSNDTVGHSYNATVTAHGGIPFYKFEVHSGSLPVGLALNSFTGVISGTPMQAGNYSFTIRVTDYDNIFSDKTFSITVAAVYIFTGNGNWSIASNWTYNLAPPDTISANMEVIINPAVGGQCSFTGTLTITPAGKLTVLAGKTFNIKRQ